MELHLDFNNGNMRGEGNDDVGRFFIQGRYDAKSRECCFTKAYFGAHTVYYRGFREGKGIWGTWEISALWHGGFHIWPQQAGEGEGRTRTTEADLPADAIGVLVETEK